jgi:hypothetical protein
MNHPSREGVQRTKHLAAPPSPPFGTSSRIRPKAFAHAHLRLPGSPKNCPNTQLSRLRNIWCRLPVVYIDHSLIPMVYRERKLIEQYLEQLQGSPFVHTNAVKASRGNKKSCFVKGKLRRGKKENQIHRPSVLF